MLKGFFVFDILARRGKRYAAALLCLAGMVLAAYSASGFAFAMDAGKTPSTLAEDGYGVADTNLGARLHDDFDAPQKDVYVENFGEENLYVRVRLSEFLRTADGAVYPEDAARTDVSTWLHYGAADFSVDQEAIAEYFAFNFGGEKYYLLGQNTDLYSNDPVQDATDYDAGDVGVALTANGAIISWDDWADAGFEQCERWVFDPYDGWAYWLNPVEPGQATGLLLNNVEQTEEGVFDYAVNVDMEASLSSFEPQSRGLFLTLYGPGELDLASQIMPDLWTGERRIYDAENFDWSNLSCDIITGAEDAAAGWDERGNTGYKLGEDAELTVSYNYYGYNGYNGQTEDFPPIESLTDIASNWYLYKWDVQGYDPNASDVEGIEAIYTLTVDDGYGIRTISETREINFWGVLFDINGDGQVDAYDVSAMNAFIRNNDPFTVDVNQPRLYHRLNLYNLGERFGGPIILPQDDDFTQLMRDWLQKAMGMNMGPVPYTDGDPSYPERANHSTLTEYVNNHASLSIECVTTDGRALKTEYEEIPDEPGATRIVYAPVIPGYTPERDSYEIQTDLYNPVKFEYTENPSTYAPAIEVSPTQSALNNFPGDVVPEDPATKLAVRKTNTEGGPLPGAQFALYAPDIYPGVAPGPLDVPDWVDSSIIINGVTFNLFEISSETGGDGIGLFDADLLSDSGMVYILYEFKAPNGYRANENQIPFMFANDTSWMGDGFFEGVVTPDEWEGHDGYNLLTVTNSRIPSTTKLAVKKTNMEGGPLSGAQFALYAPDTYPGAAPGPLNPPEGVEWSIEFGGVTFNLFEISSETDSDGIGLFEADLLSDSGMVYLLSEFKPPSGYQPDENPIAFMFADDALWPGFFEGVVTPEEWPGHWDYNLIEVTNLRSLYYGSKLPETGGTGSSSYIVLGAIITFFSFVVIIIRANSRKGGAYQTFRKYRSV